MTDERKYAKSLGRTVKILRGARTQREIAATAGIPVSTLSKIEQSRQIPRNETFAKVAHGLGLSVAELEHKVMEHTLGEIDQASGAGTTVAAGRRGPEEIDMSGIPRTAALRLESTLGTIDSLNNNIENLRGDVKSLIREFRILASSSD